jgi:hypothetical protein
MEVASWVNVKCKADGRLTAVPVEIRGDAATACQVPHHHSSGGVYKTN